MLEEQQAKNGRQGFRNVRANMVQSIHTHTHKGIEYQEGIEKTKF